MKLIQVTANAEGDTEAVVLDQYQAPFQVTYGYTGTGDVEVSITPPYPKTDGNFTEATYVWASAPTAYPNAVGFLGQPYTAIRLSGGEAGDVLTVIQAGVKG